MHATRRTGAGAFAIMPDHQSTEDVPAALLFAGSARVGMGLRIQWSVKTPFPETSRRGMWQPTQFTAGERDRVLRRANR